MTKLVCFSDTHGQHRQIKNIPVGDVLIFAGDMTGNECNRIGNLTDFCAWSKLLSHKTKLFIAGNHDFLFQDKVYSNRAIEIIE